MFSEDNILQYCSICKKCNEVMNCPIRAGAAWERITTDFIPASALDHMFIKEDSLFMHIEESMLTLRNLTEQLNALNTHIFNEG